MGELNFNNFDFSKLRAGMNIGNDNIFLKKYDKDGNSIFDAEELNALRDDLENYAGDDKKLDKHEALSLFSNIMNLTFDKAKEIFTQQGNVVVSSFNYLVTQDAKEDSVDFMQKESQTAMKLYLKSIGGDISKIVNSVKELFNTENAGDKVYRQICTKMVSAQLLTRSKDNGISKKDYVETKIALLKGLLGGVNLPENQKRLIESEIPKLTISEIDTMIVQLSNAENDTYSGVVDDIINEFALKNATPSDRGGSFSTVNPNCAQQILASAQAEELLDFEDVYLMETGGEFNPEEIQNYQKFAEYTNAVVALNNKVASINNSLDEPTKNLKNLNRNSATPQELEMAYNRLNSTILAALKELYGDSPEKISEKIKEYAGSNAIVRDGKIDFGAEGINYSSLVKLSETIQNNLTTNLLTVGQNLLLP